MKVITDTPELLIVEDRPILLSLALTAFILIFVGAGLAVTVAGEPMGLLFAAFGGSIGFAAFWAFVRRVQVVFHRPEGYVEIRRRNIFSAKTVRHNLAEVSAAVLEESSSSDGGSTWRTALVISEGESAGRHPLTFSYTSGPGHHECAEMINRWLRDSR